MTNQEINNKIEQYIRPLTYPVGVRISPGSDIPENYRRPVKLFGHRINICQGVNMARRYVWNLGFVQEDMACPLSIPIPQLQNVIEGVEVTHKRGVSRIPTPFFGLRMEPEFPKRYEELAEFCGIKKKGLPK